jgi:hypothetical protein
MAESSESSGQPTSGADFGAKTTQNKSGVVTMQAVTPKAPEQPVRH